MSSLAVAEVTRIAGDVLKHVLPAGSIQRIEAEETVDSFGDEALRVLAVVSESILVRDQAVDRWVGAGVALQDRLGAEGEKRFTYLRLVTEEELQESKQSEAA